MSRLSLCKLCFVVAVVTTSVQQLNGQIAIYVATYSSLPGTCAASQLAYLDTGSVGLYICTGNSWTGPFGSGSPTPSGLPNLVLSTDPSGSSDATASLRALVALDLPSTATISGLWNFLNGITSGTGTSQLGMYNGDGSESLWQGGATGTTYTGTYSGGVPANGKVWTASSCSGSPLTCTLGWTAPITNNQNLRTIGAVLTPTSLTACVYVPFAGTISAFHAVVTDGATVATVLVKVETQATFATFISTGVSGAADISNGGEQLTSVLGKVDAT